jgi:predicted AAA+ superfamily ATPase
MARFMEPIDQEIAEEIRKLMREVRVKIDGSKERTVTIKTTKPTLIPPLNYAMPWRQIAEPRPDVAHGRFQQAEFAADLSQVLHGKAVIEYQDPIEFFDRTYITDGMKGLLVKSVMRVSGKGGEPVIQLKTAFGGGKTHSMLALYHLMRSVNPEKLSGVPGIFAEADMDIITMPKVKVAALVGTSLDPTKSRKPVKIPGISINTLWGEMTAQLAEESGNPDLYEEIKESDKKGISPGSETIQSILEKCAPCLILIDELVAYVRKMYETKPGDIPAGTFNNVLSFVQELTEATKATSNCIVVASIPASEIETGGEAGDIALKSIEHTFGRIQTIWKPVVADEGFEIVRRRLFKPIENEDAVERTCKAFFSVYQNNPTLFPSECKEVDYLEKMKRCYPIHPEVFDRLYNDWATIDHFQRTRGVLRLMAAVIYDLYDNNDGSAMISSGSIAIGKPSIRDELTRYLSDGWNPIIESEVDGKNAKPTRLDDAQGGFYKKQFAYNRLTRAIFLGSAPSSNAQRNRGIDSSHIYLGAIQPEENIPAYEAALGALADNLSYLYHAENRHWFDTKPTLRKTVMDRAQYQSQEAVIEAIESELKTVAKVSTAVCFPHIAVKSSADIPDDQNFHFVLFRAIETHKTNDADSSAMSIAKEYLEKRGSSPRVHRNMIAFLAPDAELLSHIRQETKMLLAWKSIKKDADVLNLDIAQRRETDEAITEKERSINELIQDAWCHLIVPTQEGTNDIILKDIKISGASNPVMKAIQRMKQDELLIEALSPKVLSMEMSKKDQELWQGNNHISVRELWSYYTQYVYLHRLKNRDVLEKALEAGIRSGEYFAYAQGQTELDKYEGLFSSSDGFLQITLDGLIVKSDIARIQIGDDEKKAGEYKPESEEAQDNTTACEHSEEPAVEFAPKATHFYGSIKLEPTKLGTTAGIINTEILQHFKQLPGISIEVSLDIHVDIPNGIPDDIARIINENCSALKFDNNEFA